MVFQKLHTPLTKKFIYRWLITHLQKKKKKLREG